MAIDHNIWADIRSRIETLRADIAQQYTGDLDNSGILHTLSSLETAQRMWDQAEPVELIQTPPTGA